MENAVHIVDLISVENKITLMTHDHYKYKYNPAHIILTNSYPRPLFGASQ